MRHARSRLERAGRSCGALLFLALWSPSPSARAEPPAASSLPAVEERGAFPVGDVFRPLLADPKQPQFFVSLNQFTSEGASYTLASVGFGETFGLYRFSGSREGNGLQLGLVGAIFAQFNLSTASYNLVNAATSSGSPSRSGTEALRCASVSITRALTSGTSCSSAATLRTGST
ncbi:MAG: DUF1207 domain-containing protein [Holophagales bacterium]|nr:DUF1207 domain-containing protein [Holophagales bacterium]